MSADHSFLLFIVWQLKKIGTSDNLWVASVWSLSASLRNLWVFLECALTERKATAVTFFDKKSSQCKNYDDCSWSDGWPRFMVITVLVYVFFDILEIDASGTDCNTSIKSSWCKRIVTLTAVTVAPPGHLEEQISPGLRSESVQQAPLLQQSHINAWN